MNHTQHSAHLLHWCSFFVILIGNLLLTAVLVPFLSFMGPWMLYTLLVIFGVLMGFLYNFLIMDIGLLARKHHVLTSILLPLLAIANMVGLTLLANKFAVVTQHNPWVAGAVFAAAFLIPYVLDQGRLLLTAHRS